MMLFNDVLWLPLNVRVLETEPLATIVLGDATPHLPDQLNGVPLQPLQAMRLCFGLSLLTEPYPIILNCVLTERNTQIRSFAAYGWIDDNAIYEPRAEVLGLTPFGTQPLIFLRDLDLDVPPIAYMSTLHSPEILTKVGSVIIAEHQHVGPPLLLKGDSAAMAGIAATEPAFAAILQAEMAGGRSLRAVLKPRRRTIDPALIALADGWSVLARAVKIMLGK